MVNRTDDFIYSTPDAADEEERRRLLAELAMRQQSPDMLAPGQMRAGQEFQAPGVQRAESMAFAAPAPAAPPTDDPYRFSPPGTGFAGGLPQANAEGADIVNGMKDPGAAMRADPAQAAFERYGGNPIQAEPTSNVPRVDIRTLGDGAQVFTDPITGQVFTKEPGRDVFAAPRAPSIVPDGRAHQGDLQGYIRSLAANAAPGSQTRADYMRLVGMSADPLAGIPMGNLPDQAVAWPDGLVAGQGQVQVTPQAIEGQVQGISPEQLQRAFAPDGAQLSPEGSILAQGGQQAQAPAPAAQPVTGNIRDILQGNAQGRAQAEGETPPDVNGTTYPIIGRVQLPTGGVGEVVRTPDGDVMVWNPDTQQYETDLSALVGEEGALPEGAQLIDDRGNTAVAPDGGIYRKQGGTWIRVA